MLNDPDCGIPSDPSKNKSKHKKKKKKKRKREKHKSKSKEETSSGKGKHSEKDGVVDLSHLSAFLPNGSNTLPVDILKNLNKIGSILPSDKSVTKLKSSAKNSRVNQRRGEADVRTKVQKFSNKDNSTSERTSNEKASQQGHGDGQEPDHLSELRAFSQLSSQELLVREKPCRSRTLFHEKINTHSVDNLRKFLQEREDQRQALYPLGKYWFKSFFTFLS